MEHLHGDAMPYSTTRKIGDRIQIGDGALGIVLSVVAIYTGSRVKLGIVLPDGVLIRPDRTDSKSSSLAEPGATNLVGKESKPKSTAKKRGGKK